MYINDLTVRVEKLARTQGNLRDENTKLKLRNDELEQLVTQQKNALTELEEQNKVVKIAKAVTDSDTYQGEDDRKEQRKRLNELVREIDKCIALLNN